ncbi:hypothetical protein V8E55_009141 [Tylopilus felleus]
MLCIAVWQLGLAVSLKTDATGSELPAELKLKLKVALRDIKAKDLPIEDTDHAKETWNHLTALIVDWAGTMDDPFGTNENPDLMLTIQELWNALFLDEHHVDVTNYPAIRKVCDQLNTWRSEIGKCRISCLERYFKAAEYRDSRDARTAFVQSQLPFIRDNDQEPMYPLIYADTKNMKGAWKAPLILSIFATHIHRVGADRFLSFGNPKGALALCTALFERALELFKDGENAKDTKGDFTGNSNNTVTNQGRGARQSCKDQFDHKWSMATRQYALSTGKLGEKKWQKISSLAIVLLADPDDAGVLQLGTSSSMKHLNEDYLMVARAEIGVSDSEDEGVEGFWDEED